MYIAPVGPNAHVGLPGGDGGALAGTGGWFHSASILGVVLDTEAPCLDHGTDVALLIGPSCARPRLVDV